MAWRDAPASAMGRLPEVRSAFTGALDALASRAAALEESLQAAREADGKPIEQPMPGMAVKRGTLRVFWGLLAALAVVCFVAGFWMSNSN